MRRPFFQDHRLRSQGFSKLEEALKCSETLAHIQSYLPSLLKTLLSVERHPEIIQQKQRTVTNLILRLPLENLENNFGRILTGITKQGGPSSNVIAKSMMTRLPTAAIVTKLLSDEFLENRTSKVILFETFYEKHADDILITVQRERVTDDYVRIDYLS